MNELEKMKDLWDKSETENQFQNLNKTKIMETINLKSSSVFGKLLENLKKELVISAFGMAFFVYAVLGKSSFYGEEFKLFYAFLTGVCLVMGVWIWQQYRIIKSYQFDDTDLKTNLGVAYSQLRIFTDTYFKANLLVWASLGYLFYIVFYCKEPDFNWAILSILTIVSLIVGYVVQKWYVQWRFGKYLNQLKECLDELTIKQS